MSFLHSLQILWMNDVRLHRFFLFQHFTQNIEQRFKVFFIRISPDTKFFLQYFGKTICMNKARALFGLIIHKPIS
jgi:hypothetical protein